ncbi:hypothetical protein V8E36_008226 [Tilletia maclaganii]
MAHHPDTETLAKSLSPSQVPPYAARMYLSRPLFRDRPSPDIPERRSRAVADSRDLDMTLCSADLTKVQWDSPRRAPMTTGAISGLADSHSRPSSQRAARSPYIPVPQPDDLPDPQSTQADDNAVRYGYAPREAFGQLGLEHVSTYLDSGCDSGGRATLPILAPAPPFSGASRTAQTIASSSLGHSFDEHCSFAPSSFIFRTTSMIRRGCHGSHAVVCMNREPERQACTCL